MKILKMNILVLTTANIPYKNPITISPVEVKCYKTNTKQIAQTQNLDDKYDGETLYIQLEDKFNPDNTYPQHICGL